MEGQPTRYKNDANSIARLGRNSIIFCGGLGVVGSLANALEDVAYHMSSSEHFIETGKVTVVAAVGAGALEIARRFTEK